MTKYLWILIFLLLPTIANGATINASSCDYYDVLAAYNSASDGDTINIPSGVTTWPTTFSMSGKNVDLIGDSASGTTITGPSGAYTIDIAATDTAFEIGYINVNGNKAGKGFYIDSSPKNFRIHHCHIKHVKSYVMWIMGNSYGVIDHNTFESCQGGGRIDGSTTVCTNATALGTGTDTIYFEDNIIDYNAADYNASFSSSSHHWTTTGCGRIGFRKNDVNIENGTYLTQIDHFDVHGYCFTSRYCTRGAYSYEIWDNTFAFAKAQRCMNVRGGRGVIYDNAFTVSSWVGTADEKATVYLQNYRSDYSSGYSLCTDATKCVDSEGYPCTDQINNLYIWNNTLNGVALADGTDILVDDDDDTPTHIQLGIDFFEHSAVTAIGYSPYTYPHPLQGGSVTVSNSKGSDLDEPDIVTGVTVYYTITGDTFTADSVTSGNTNNHVQAGFSSNRSETYGFVNTVQANWGHADFSLNAGCTRMAVWFQDGNYNPTQVEETISFEVPGAATTSGVTQTADTFSIGVEDNPPPVVGEMGPGISLSNQGMTASLGDEGQKVTIKDD